MSETPTIGEERIERLELTVPEQGPWVADCQMEGDPVLSGEQTIMLGSTRLVGTVVMTGIFGGRTTLQIQAGGAGWSRICTAKSYQLDQGVRALLVWQDLLRDVGEKAGQFVPGKERLGLAFARNTAQGSAILESIIGGAQWWVGYDGLTHVGSRAAQSPTNYEVLAYDPSDLTVEIALDDLSELRVGSILTERLPSPVTVKSYRLTVSHEGIRATCQGAQDLPALLRAIVRHEIGLSVSTFRKYRVLGMTSDGRVNLQIVQKATGFPDLGSVTMWPGVAGAHCELKTGCEVVVAWVDGDRTQPIIVGFVGIGGASFAPTRVTFNSPVDFKGAIDISGAVTASGSVTAGGEVAANATLPATKVTLSKHTHTTSTGITTPPIVPEGGP